MTEKRSESAASSRQRGVDPLDELSINTIRTLAMDAVQEASSGHPGTAMAMAPVAYCLWQQYLPFDAEDPIWPNRERFVLSIGHTSMLLYALLHLSGVRAVNPKYERLGSLSVPLDDIRLSRQAGDRGRPRLTPWRRRDSAHQARLRLARGRTVSRAHRVRDHKVSKS